MAQQLETKYQLSNLIFYFTLAQKGRNISGYSKSSGAATDPLVQDVSNRGLPQVIGRIRYHNGDFLTGIMYTYAKFDYENAQNTASKGQNTHSAGFKAYLQEKFGNLDFRIEGYQGSNLNNLFILTLAERSMSFGKNRDIYERGGFTSLKYHFENKDSIYFGHGIAQIISDKKLIKENRLIDNKIFRLGYSKQIEEGFTTFIEVNNYSSLYTKTNGGGDTSRSQAILAEAGAVYQF